MFNPLSVLVDFKFEIASAVMNTEALKGSVNSLSQAADNALNSMKTLSLDMAAKFGLGSLSTVGVLYSAITAQDKYYKSQLDWTNIISSNLNHLEGPVKSHQERLLVSEKILGRIGHLSKEFNLDAGELNMTAKNIAAMLIPKGLAGKDFEAAIDLSRGLLKSAPTLNVDPGMIQGELLRALEGQASMQDTFFRRLVQETSVFKELTKGNLTTATALFNMKVPAERVELLRKALGQFASDLDVLNGRVSSISGQIQRFKNLITGENYITAIFRPIGDALQGPIVKMFKMLNDWIDKDGRAIVQKVGFLLGKVFEDPIKTYEGLMNIKKMGGVFNDVGSKFGLIGMVIGIVEGSEFLLKYLGKFTTFLARYSQLAAGALNILIGPFLMLMSVLKPMVAFIPAIVIGFSVLGKLLFAYVDPIYESARKIVVSFGLITAAIVSLGVAAAIVATTVSNMFTRTVAAFATVLIQLIPQILATLAIFTIIEHAITKANIVNAKWLADNASRINDAFAKATQSLWAVAKPFEEVLSFYSDIILKFFEASTWGEIVITALEGIATALKSFAIAVKSVFATIKVVSSNLAGIFSFMDLAKRGQRVAASDLLNRIFNGQVTTDVWKKQFEDLNSLDGKIVPVAVTNIGHQENRFEFKEQMEPDRVAFAVGEHLKRVAANRTQGKAKLFNASPVLSSANGGF